MNTNQFIKMCFVLLLVAMLPVVSAGDTKTKDTDVRKGGERTIAAIDGAEEKAALAFAQKHHKELFDLLKQLRSVNSVEYQRALRELHIASQRINRWDEKQPERFQQELQTWKLESEVRLLVARWTMSQDPKLETEIRKLLQQRYEDRIARLEQERVRLKERLEAVDKQLESGRSGIEQAVDSEWTRLARRAQDVHKRTRPANVNSDRKKNRSDTSKTRTESQTKKSTGSSK